MRTEALPLPLSRARALLGALALLSAGMAAAAEPASVELVGSVQDSPACTADATKCALTFDANDTAWQGVVPLSAGTWTYRVAVDGTPEGEERSLTLGADTQVKFYYDSKSRWVTTRFNSAIAVAPGNFQNELGCTGDWDPSCLRSWLKDPDGDGIYTFTTTALPAGGYEGKVAHNESWDENYGANGAPGGGNIGFSVPSLGTPVVFQYNLSTHKLNIEVVGAPKGNIHLARAHWVSGDLLVWEPGVAAIPANASFRLHHDPNGAMVLGPTGIVGGESITLTQELLGLPPHIAAKFPHLTGKPVLRIAKQEDLIRVPEILKGQVALSLTDVDGNLMDATSAQLPGVLDELYANDEALGVTWLGEELPLFKLWAPTARNVTLYVFDSADPDSPFTTAPMVPDLATGVWSIEGWQGFKGKFYLYEVEVYVPSAKKVVKNMVTDPYSLSLSTNSTRSQIVDLSDPALAPEGWASLSKPALAAPEDIVLYELHVRDFSINDTTVPPEKRGTFSAFTESGSNGMRHLKRLAMKGLTHVHLLPVFDLATIEEDRSKQQSPEGDLSLFAPDSEEQQRRVTAVRDLDGFNWGYDPYHYTVPEGSYAVDPNGPSRIREFREMVRALSDSGLRVVMDVVYNHTASAGQADKSVLDKVVPGYYHRLNADGNVETSTCCQNTASEHAMFEKLMVDSLVTWAKAYKVDGFRFDLMGHHMKANMVKAQERLRALTLEKDGVDGSKIYLYGEGWNFGEVVNNTRGENATQLNMPGTGIGTFSDRLRDAARGGGPFSGLQEQGFSSGLWFDPNGTDQGAPEHQRLRLLHYMDLIRVGLAGNLRDYSLVNKDGSTVMGWQVDYNGQPAGYTLDPQEVITYVSAHDNETLFDAIQLKAPASANMEARVRMHNMAMSLVALGQGIPFFHAGDELLRSKSLDRNSYNSGDWFNKLDFSYESNNWGVGLPPAGDNQDKWPVMKPLLANPDLKPGSAHIVQALDHVEEMLAIRKSADLFRLRTAEDIQAKVRFHNVGPSQIPGLIVMNLRDETAADGITDIVVLFNANDEQQEFRLADYEGRMMQLHPLQANSLDPIVRASMFVPPTGSFIVPGRTTAVFINSATVPGDAGTDGGVDGGSGDVDGGYDAGSPVDAGTDFDAGTEVDAGTGYDGGFEYDAGTGYDGGFEYDAGTGYDGGFEYDAGTTTDAGTDPEPADAGTTTDAGTDPEPAAAGTTTDAGTTPWPTDAGTTTDAGTDPEPVDAGTTTDAGTDPEPVDAGTTTDAGTDPEPVDAGTTTDAGTDPEPADSGTDPEPADSGTDPEPADSGTDPEPADAGTDPEPVDSGTTTDAGTQPADAGTNPGTDAGTGNGGGNNGGGCGGCAGTGGEAFSALALLLGGVMQSRRRRRA